MNLFYKNISLALLFTLLGCSCQLNAQKPNATTTIPQHQTLDEITIFEDPNGWFYFREGTSLSPGQLFTHYGEDLGLPPTDEMRLYRQKSDNYGNTRYKYQQYHQGIYVEGAEFVETFKGNELTIANGKIMKKNALPKSAVVNQAQAEKFALRHFVGEVYRMANEDPGTHLPLVLTNEAVAVVSKKENLLYTYAAFDDSSNPTDYRLSWKFVLESKVSFQQYEVHIDAVSGKLIKMFSRLHADGPANTEFHGTRWIDTSTDPVTGFRQMWAGNGGRNIFTREIGATVTQGQLIALDAESEPIWTTGSTSDDWRTGGFDEAATAHWGVSEAYEYFDVVHNHDSWDDNGEDVNVLTNANIGNSFFVPSTGGPDYLVFGRLGAANVPFSSIDVAGHEFTHGLVNREVGLVGGSTESAALNESFSDIFGSLTELRSIGSTDWDWGDTDAAYITAGADRDMINPGNTGDPSVYQGTNWDASLNNIHQNGQVQNKWFTLLALGGTQSGINVTSIGTDDAAEIVYHSLTNGMLTSTANFADARANSIACAIDIFGECSFEHVMVAKAWAAVGIGAARYRPSEAYIEGPSNPSQSSFIDYDIRNEDCINYTGWSISPSSAGTIWFDGANSMTVTFNQSGPVTLIYSGTSVETGQVLTIERTINVASSGGGSGFLLEDPTEPALQTAAIESIGMTAYPNPLTSGEALKVKFSNLTQGGQELVVTDMVGRQLFRTDNLTNGTNRFDRLSLRAGTYNLGLYDGKGNVLSTSRIVVQ